MAATEPDTVLRRFMAAERLPEDFAETARRHFLPLATTLARRAAAAGRPLLVGIHGCQGSGKSTLAALLAQLLRESHGLDCIDLSLDDFYLTHAERERLAQQVHPLLRTRGVPGTHDIGLLMRTLDALARPGDAVAVPRFDKARDDRRPPDQWPRLQPPLDLVILEGWCLGVPPQSEAQLAEPVNALEAEEDPDGRWRRFVNERLAEDYQALHARVDYWIMLQAPGFDCVLAWRLEQERRLAERLSASGGDTGALMDEARLRRFVAHYQRLTEHALRVLPDRVDRLFRLDPQRHIRSREEPR
ncbi:MAG TPA: hypothetical protein ENJ94_07525 [Gammaproteobacteria bacterium]|nr:hypothetical protein [Gammaproteobacteria bacterium]